MPDSTDKESDLSVKPEEYIEVISTDDERIKIIGEELANDTGRAIFGKISQGVTSSNELAKTLEISLPLVNWHINRLLSVGLIKVDKVEMSQKNKQMKYYGPVKTALVIIPPDSTSDDTMPISKKDTVLMKLRHYMASVVAFVIGASGLYIFEKNQTPAESAYVPQMAAKTMLQAATPMHAAINGALNTSVSIQPSPTPVEPSILSGDQMMILFALVGGSVMFCAVFFGIKLAGRLKNKKIKTIH
ncbi:MAG: winged helix-turn-helix transcriptional regulator [Thaumarchaeota archaeon]|nr:winged helix-turn-helix transcriptional regulator [Nitrososphaerota archaeon]